jgi:hypothetical protein
MTISNILSKPKPHPLFYRLKSHKLPLLRVSHFLKIPNTTFYLQVAGYKDMEPGLEKKLTVLINQLEKRTLQCDEK